MAQLKRAKPLTLRAAGESVPMIALPDVPQRPQILKAEVSASPHDDQCKIVFMYCVDRTAECLFSHTRFLDQDEIELMVLDQLVMRVRDLEATLDGDVLRVDLPLDVAWELDGTRQYVVNLMTTDVELQHVRDALSAIFEGKKELLITSSHLCQSRANKKARRACRDVSSRRASSLACQCADLRSPAWSSCCSLCRLDWWRGGARHRCRPCVYSLERSDCPTSHHCASLSSCGNCCFPGSKTLRCGYHRLWPAPMCMPKLPLSGSLFSSF